MSDEKPAQPPLLAALPLWVQAVSIVGFPILVAGFYMAKDVGLVPSVLTANAELLAQIVDQHESHLTSLRESIRLQREVCRNTSHTPDSLRVCNQGE
jgi:hypothetical protein